MQSAHPICDLTDANLQTLASKFPTDDGQLHGVFAPLLSADPDGTDIHPARAEVGYLLYSIETAQNPYCLVSLGAAPGEWPVRAAIACQLHQPPLECRSFSVEADIGHVNLIKDTFAQLSLDADRHRIIHAAISPKDGWAYFPAIKSGTDWGAGVAAFSEKREELDSNIIISDAARRDRLSASGESELTFNAVPALALGSLFKQTGPVDCVHCDIQGAEADVFPEQMAALAESVRICCVATHGRGIEEKLTRVFGAHGWILDNASPCVPSQSSPDIVVRDGAFVWINPRLHGAHGQ